MFTERASKNGPIDIYRDTYLRYLGYLGPFSITLSRFIPISVARMACTSYIMCDLHDKLPECNVKNYKKESLITGGDVTIFHLLSTFLLPAAVSRSITNHSQKLLSRAPGFARFFPGVLTLAFIPIASRFIDNGTKYAMDKSYRSIFGKSQHEQKFEHGKGIFDEHYDENFGRRAEPTDSFGDQKNGRQKNENNEKNSRNEKNTKFVGSRKNEQNEKNEKNEKNYGQDTDENKNQRKSRWRTRKAFLTEANKESTENSKNKRSSLNDVKKESKENSKIKRSLNDNNKDPAENFGIKKGEPFSETKKSAEERKKERNEYEKDPDINRII